MEWPPRFEELRATEPDSHVALYPQKIWQQLNESPNTRERTHYEKQILCKAIVHLDSFAASSVARLTFGIGELAFGIPPPAVAADERAFKRWQGEHADYECIDAAYRARCAIFAGEFIEAIDAALDAGHYSRFRFAERASKSGRGLTAAGSESNRDRAKRHREIILREAKEIRSKYVSEGKKYNIKSIADEIHCAHKAETDFPKFDSIRRTLGGDKSWESTP